VLSRAISVFHKPKQAPFFPNVSGDSRTFLVQSVFVHALVQLKYNPVSGLEGLLMTLETSHLMGKEWTKKRGQCVQ
jgi:hypothetical protein